MRDHQCSAACDLESEFALRALRRIGKRRELIQSRLEMAERLFIFAAADRSLAGALP